MAERVDGCGAGEGGGERGPGAEEAGGREEAAEGSPEVWEQPEEDPSEVSDGPDFTAEHAGLIRELRRLCPDLELHYRAALVGAEKELRGAAVSLEPYPAERVMNLALDRLLALPHPRPEPAQPPTADQIRAQARTAFPRVCPEWLEKQVTAGKTLAQIVELVFDPNAYVPRRQTKRDKARLAQVLPPDPPKAAPLNYFTRPLAPRWRDRPYLYAAEAELATKFRRIGIRSIRHVLYAYQCNFAPAFKAIWDEYQNAGLRVRMRRIGGAELATSRPLNPPGYRFPVERVWILKCVRAPRRSRLAPSPVFQEELAWVKKQMARLEQDDSSCSESTQPREEEAADMAECPVCVLEKPQLLFVACRDGHSFCRDCVATEARELMHGRGGWQLACLEGGCGAGFTDQVLRGVLTEAERQEMEERRGASAVGEALRQGHLHNFTKCKYCAWGAVVETGPEADKVFRCQACEAEYCRVCEKDWDDVHMGRRCSELETDADAAKRKRLEEQLTAAILRRCHRCGLQFQKAEGCNKMTCQCGATSCYLCRAQDVDYPHFCQHPRDPGQPCAQCNRCWLWQNPEELDRRNLNAAQAQNEVDPSQSADLATRASQSWDLDTRRSQSADLATVASQSSWGLVSAASQSSGSASLSSAALSQATGTSDGGWITAASSAGSPFLSAQSQPSSFSRLSLPTLPSSQSEASLPTQVDIVSSLSELSLPTQLGTVSQ